MTKEDIENNYTYRIIKRALTRELPFIKDVTFDEEDIKKYTATMFIDLVIDVNEMAKMYDTQVWDIIQKKLDRGESYDSSAMALFIDGPDRSEIGRKITDDIQNVINQIQQASVIPNELKLNKRIYTSNYTALPKK